MDPASANVNARFTLDLVLGSDFLGVPILHRNQMDPLSHRRFPPSHTGRRVLTREGQAGGNKENGIHGPKTGDASIESLDQIDTIVGSPNEHRTGGLGVLLLLV